MQQGLASVVAAAIHQATAVSPAQREATGSPQHPNLKKKQAA